MKFLSAAVATLVAGTTCAFQSPATTSSLFRQSAAKPVIFSQAEDSSSAVLEDVDGVGGVAAVLVDDPVANETSEEDILQLLVDVEEEATKATEEIMLENDEEDCALDPETGGALDEICVEESEAREGFRNKLKSTIGSTLKLVRGVQETDDGMDGMAEDSEELKEVGDLLEDGWSQRGGASALRRNGEVWKFALKSVFRALKPRSMRKKGASEEEVQAAQIAAAEFIRDGLLTLGPTFVKLGQVS